MASNNILVLFAHPAIHKSKVNRRLIRIYDEFENVTFRDLYDVYPHFLIDVRYEQRLLLQNDIIVFHHPFYWYSAPPVVKQWMDLVLERGFAFGVDGDALKTKHLFSVVTTGRDRDAYEQAGHTRRTMRDYLLPFEQMARFCGMNYLPPFIVHRIVLMNGKEKFQDYVKQFRQTMTMLSDENFDARALGERVYMNQDQMAGYMDQETRL